MRKLQIKKGTGGGGGGVTSFNGRAGAVVPVANDYDFIELGDVPSSYAGFGGYFPQINSTPNGLQFVDIGFSGAITADAATTTTLPAYTYNNGASGVGATLTANANGAFPTIDGIAAGLNKDYAIWKETGANRRFHGVYTLTDAGSAGSTWILTRKTNSDSTSELNEQIVFVIGGTANGKKYLTQGTPSPVINTNNIIYTLNRAGTASAGLASVLGVSNDAGGLDIINLETLETDNITIGDGAFGEILDAGGTITIQFNTATNTMTAGASGGTTNIIGDTISLSAAASILNMSGVAATLNSNSGLMRFVSNGAANADFTGIDGTVAFKRLSVQTGANKWMGTADLANGTVTVSTTAVRSTSQIFLTKAVGAGTSRGILTVGTIVDSTSFVINAENLLGGVSGDDDSTVNWFIIDPAA